MILKMPSMLPGTVNIGHQRGRDRQLTTWVATTIFQPVIKQKCVFSIMEKR